MPIVGIFIVLVISFASEVFTHSKTIEKTPASSRSLESFKILVLSEISLHLKQQNVTLIVEVNLSVP
jgi:hypothetical protein